MYVNFNVSSEDDSNHGERGRMYIYLELESAIGMERKIEFVMPQLVQWLCLFISLKVSLGNNKPWCSACSYLYTNNCIVEGRTMQCLISTYIQSRPLNCPHFTHRKLSRKILAQRV